MKRFVLLPLLLSACAHDQVEVAPGAAAGICRAERTASLVGQRFDTKLEARARAQTGAAAIRLVRPGEMVTMDFRADRLTLRLDAEGVVTGASCG